MGLQLATTTRNARLQAIETEIGSNAIFKILTGAAPTDCSTTDPGTVLVTITIPGVADWMATPSGGAMVKQSGTWSAAASATGTAGHFRLFASDGTTCKMQGSCGIGTGDLQLDNTSITTGQVVTITAFTLTDGNP